MPGPKLEGVVTVPTGGWSVSAQEFTPNAGPLTVTVAAGTYSIGELLAALVAALNASALGGTYAGTLDDDTDTATGRATLSATGVTTFSITWTSTDLRDALGFTGTLTGAASYQSTPASPLLFLPDGGLSPIHSPAGHTGIVLTDGTMTVAPSGSYVGRRYAERRADVLRFSCLRGFKTWAKTWTGYTAITNESLETFWRTVMSQGRAFRFMPDRSVDATYVPYAAAEFARYQPVPVDPGWVHGHMSLWNFDLPVIGG